MVNLMSRLLRGQCLRHAEPLFDRDATGAIFRCPHCLAAWPRPHRHEVAPGGLPAAVNAVPLSPVPGSPAPASMLPARSKRRSRARRLSAVSAARA
jgi:hypothetical protein